MTALATEWKEVVAPVTESATTIDLARILDCICKFLQRHVVFSSPAQVVIIALWVVHTWILDAFDCTPYLHVSSPEKRSGKTSCSIAWNF